MNVLSVDNIKKKYKTKNAVNGISFEINKGDVFGLIGENGAGKSTTISMIATLIKPDSGDILLDDVSIVSKPKIIRKQLGYIPQDIALYPMLSGMDNLELMGKAYHLSKSQIRSSIDRIKDIIELSDEVLKDKVCNYSGGMKRRVNIGAALLHDPDIIIMDEPTVGIDVNSRRHIVRTINELKNNGKTILYTGHYMPEIEAICNKICIMSQGNIIEMGDTQELLSGREKQFKDLESFYLDVINKNVLD